jgi:rsbT co-antagonist protein RsbR
MAFQSQGAAVKTSDTPEIESGHIDQLRRRVEDLERELDAHRDAETRLMQSEQQFSLLLQATREGIVLLDDGVLVDANPRFTEMLGYRPGEVIGRPATDFIAPESHELVLGLMRTESEEPYEALGIRKDGSRLPVEACGRMIRRGGRTLRVGAILDISQHKRAEQALREALRQREIIAELSTPLLPILQEVVLLPLIGQIDAERAGQMVETLMEGVMAHRATIAILDITGVPGVDTQVASSILKAARSVELLGAELILTGVRAEVARTFVQLGMDLAGVVTRSTLHAGIAYALHRRSSGKAVSRSEPGRPGTTGHPEPVEHVRK